MYVAATRYSGTVQLAVVRRVDATTQHFTRTDSPRFRQGDSLHQIMHPNTDIMATYDVTRVSIPKEN